MSRIGKNPVPIPDKVSIDIQGLSITVKGPKGELKRVMPSGVNFDKTDQEVIVSPSTSFGFRFPAGGVKKLFELFRTVLPFLLE